MKQFITGALTGIILVGVIVVIRDFQSPKNIVTFIDQQTGAEMGTWPMKQDLRHTFNEWCLFNEYDPELLAGETWAIQN